MKIQIIFPLLLTQAYRVAAAPAPTPTVALDTLYVELSIETIWAYNTGTESGANAVVPKTITSRIPVSPYASKPTGLSTTTYTTTFIYWSSTRTFVEVVLPTGMGRKTQTSSSTDDTETVPRTGSSWDLYKEYRDGRVRISQSTRIIIWAVAGTVSLLSICAILHTSYKHFSAMMCGLERKRGVTVIWCCCIHCLVPCAGPRWKARGIEDQRVLFDKWYSLGRSKRVSLWLKWGFKWKYPVDLLGEEPERLNRT